MFKHFASMVLVLSVVFARSAQAGGGNSCATDLNGDGAIGMDDLLLVVGAWGPCATPPDPCPADLAPAGGDGQVDIFDLLAVIGVWGPCPVGACWVPGNSCTVLTESGCAKASGAGWVQGGTCADSDADRIPDVYELNNCSAPAIPFAGTNPGLADTDGDLLKDGDELYGTLSGVDLAAMGCNPLRKNAMMEVDWFDDADGGAHTHRPSANACNLLIASFENSPVTNVCGGTGISLIIDYGQGGAFTGGNLIPGGDTVVLFDSEFNTYKAANFAANRNGLFYYSIHAHRYNSATNGSSGISEINGDDHMVTLMTFLSDSNVSKTMMHEYGHNLNLRHGGNQDLNYKPNYNSVMNYRYQFPGADTNCNASGDGSLNYSLGLNITLNENALNEAAGVCGSSPIDWNGNSVIDVANIARNINCNVGASTACGTSSGSCIDTTCGTLPDHNDWAAVVFTGLNHSDFAPPEVVTCDAPHDAPRDPQ